MNREKMIDELVEDDMKMVRMMSLAEMDEFVQELIVERYGKVNTDLIQEMYQNLVLSKDKNA